MLRGSLFWDTRYIRPQNLFGSVILVRTERLAKMLSIDRADNWTRRRGVSLVRSVVSRGGIDKRQKGSVGV